MKDQQDTRKEYFQLSYQRGSDIWTHIPWQDEALDMLPEKEDLLALDLGCGRGSWIFKLIQENHRVLGIDYIKSVVEDINNKIKNEDLAKKARVLTGNALDIPFTTKSFDLLSDIGLFQHLHENERTQYLKEIARVLKDESYYLNISLSSNTKSLFGFSPQKTGINQYEKFGLSYYFSKPQDIQIFFKGHFNIIEQKERSYPSQSDPEDSITLLFTLMQKKNTH